MSIGLMLRSIAKRCVSKHGAAPSFEMPAARAPQDEGGLKQQETFMLPNTPRYVTPKERAENRARIRAWLYWTAVAIPAAIALMMFGYSDQAPQWLRAFTVSLDTMLGFPFLWLVKTLLA
jgi:hypothetical protein